ncbi:MULTISPECIES: GTPase HflX [Methanothrix]|jgi:GTP-binding protein HflX|uniref:GTPase HflX n=1 Tax=Methanothrix TaxID=2222 RepID=UPI002B734648|nr:GTPase HflX [Methanothrix sp.]HRW31909.1 GTPase HflX [Methanothrix sp.]
MDNDKTAVLLMRENPANPIDPYRMIELRGLANAAGYRVLQEIKQRRERDHRFQIGRGKIEEALSCHPKKLIFYNPLSPTQVFNIRSEFPAQVLDRFNLILEIFASRASTREAKLQVELARLSYDAPQVRSELALKKRGEQPGFRGAGAYEQSMYHDIRGRMAKIRGELKEVEAMGEGRRKRRRELGFDLIALAGYTNAGKSTLLNTLTGSVVNAQDQPFTTLSPTTRALEINGRRTMLTDTVGFIDDLPHFLIKAFQSTLSEIAQADLVLLVADLSDPLELLRRKLVASHKALWDCQVTAPMITVLNKMDRLDEFDARMRFDQIKDLAPNPVMVSAHSSQGQESLKECIYQHLPPLKEYQIRLPYTSRSFGVLSRLYGAAELLDVSYEDELVLSLQGRAEDVARLSKAAEDERAK